MLRRPLGITVASVAGCVGFLAACVGMPEDTVGTSGQSVTGACAVTPIVDRSLFVTDATALAKFTLDGVLTSIVSSGSTTGQTALGLYQQMLDTLNTKALGVTSGPHCDDVKSGGEDLLNGFPIECPRQEGTLAKTNPFTKGSADSYQPVGVVNRFDLAPTDGSNCGQYRIVFGKVSGLSNPFDRMFLIFEAVLPNPTPKSGIAACLPVAEFWDDLSSDASASSRATKLSNFYFKGLTGFEPVVRAQNYGIGRGTNTGQIRANMFMNQVSGQQWELREFRLSQKCTGSACTLTADNTFVQTNPFGGLFNGTTSQDETAQTAFLAQVSPLAARSIPAITMTTPNVDNAGESDEQDSSNDYFAQASANKAFLSKITAQLKTLKRTDLTAENILDRATTQSCAGCHQVAVGRSLGDGLVWPFSNGFTQVDERSDLSPALTGSFLPARATVLVDFIDTENHCKIPDAGTDSGQDSGGGADGSPGDAGGPPPPVDGGPPPPVGLTLGGSAVGSSN
jgi:hypothetical protein